MTYQSMAQLRIDSSFSSRVQSCVVEQARIMPTDAFTRAVKLNTMTITSMFVNLMVTDPALIAAYEAGGVDAITDTMISSGVQSEWSEVSLLYMSTSASSPLAARQLPS
jgi:hypothetical protein